jgi:hypothetical protein
MLWWASNATGSVISDAMKFMLRAVSQGERGALEASGVRGAVGGSRDRTCGDHIAATFSINCIMSSKRASQVSLCHSPTVTSCCEWPLLNLT